MDNNTFILIDLIKVTNGCRASHGLFYYKMDFFMMDLRGWGGLLVAGFELHTGFGCQVALL